MFFLGVLIALTVWVCGTAFADLAYIDSYFVVVANSKDILQEAETPFSAKYVHSFTHKGSSRILLASREGDIAVYDPEDLTAPLSRGKIPSEYIYDEELHRYDLRGIAELGNNIVMIVKDGVALAEIDPETCSIVNTYESDWDAPDYYHDITDIYAYKGQIVVVVDLVRKDSTANREAVIATMDSLGHITGRINNYLTYEDPFEASGGELYFAKTVFSGDTDEQRQGIYRVSNMLGNMNIANAVRVTTDNPCYMTRDGKGGLYYAAYAYDSSNNTSSRRYICYWNGSSTSRIYDAGSEGSIHGMEYDISDDVLYVNLGNIQIDDILVSDGDKTLMLSNKSIGNGQYSYAVVSNPSDKPISSDTPGCTNTPTSQDVSGNTNTPASQDVSGNTNAPTNNVSSSSGGGCNAGEATSIFGVLLLTVISFRKR